MHNLVHILKCTGYNIILDSSVLPALCQRFGFASFQIDNAPVYEDVFQKKKRFPQFSVEELDWPTQTLTSTPSTTFGMSWNTDWARPYHPTSWPTSVMLLDKYIPTQAPLSSFFQIFQPYVAGRVQIVVASGFNHVPKCLVRLSTLPPPLLLTLYKNYIFQLNIAISIFMQMISSCITSTLLQTRLGWPQHLLSLIQRSFHSPNKHKYAFYIAQSLGVSSLIHFLNGNLISNPKVVMGMNLSQIPTQGPLCQFWSLQSFFYR